MSRSPSESPPRVLVYVPGGGFQLESQLLLRQLEGLDIALVLPRDSVLSPWMEAFPVFRVAPLVTRANRRPWRIVRRVIDNFRESLRALRAHRPAYVVCIGSSICLPGFVLASLRGVKRVYIESITRTDTISATGRLVERIGLASRFYVQWPGQAGARRIYRGSVL